MFWMTKKDRRIEYLELKLKNTENEYHGEMSRNTFLRNRIRELEDENKELSFRPVDKPVQSNIDLQSPLFQRIIKAGRNSLIKKAHPDHGGTR